jgi:hypothetical protein
VSDQDRRVLNRLLPEGSGSATDTLTHNITVATDEAIAELIRADRDGGALRAAGFIGIADAIYRALGGREEAPAQ